MSPCRSGWGNKLSDVQFNFIFFTPNGIRFWLCVFKSSSNWFLASFSWKCVELCRRQCEFVHVQNQYNTFLRNYFDAGPNVDDQIDRCCQRKNNWFAKLIFYSHWIWIIIANEALNSNSTLRYLTSTLASPRITCTANKLTFHWQRLEEMPFRRARGTCLITQSSISVNVPKTRARKCGGDVLAQNNLSFARCCNSIWIANLF